MEAEEAFGRRWEIVLSPGPGAHLMIDGSWVPLIPSSLIGKKPL